MWVYSDDTAYAALAIDNVGGRDVVIDKVQVRGVEAAWSDVHYIRVSAAISGSLICQASTANWTEFEYISGTNSTFTSGSTDLPLASGDTLIIYISSPDSINVNDVGTTIGLTVFTENAQYYVECNVKTCETP